MGEQKGRVHWSATAIYPRFIIFDARCLFPIFIFLLHISMETFIMAVIGVIFFSCLNYFSITPIVCLRSIRRFISGSTVARHDAIIYRRRLK